MPMFGLDLNPEVSFVICRSSSSSFSSYYSDDDDDEIEFVSSLKRRESLCLRLDHHHLFKTK